MLSDNQKSWLATIGIPGSSGGWAGSHMGQHDQYGKRVMARACGDAFTDWGPTLAVDLGAGQPGRIDGTVASKVAVEIESRVSKQVRGSLLDLVLHPYERKLLVLLPVHMANPETTREQCRHIMGCLLEPENFRVILLRGTGDLPAQAADVQSIRAALMELGWNAAV